jgi:hypothetical protein
MAQPGWAPKNHLSLTRSRRDAYCKMRPRAVPGKVECDQDRPHRGGGLLLRFCWKRLQHFKDAIIWVLGQAVSNAGRDHAVEPVVLRSRRFE